MGFASADVVPLPLSAAKVEVRTADVSPDLLSRARAGDSAALGALARGQIPQVERLLSRMLGPRQDLEDLVQTVLLELCRALPRFREESLFSTFVGGITVHVARRAMRGTAWDRRRLPLGSEPIDDRSSVEGRADARRAIDRLHAAIAGLSDDHRVAFTLWALEGMEPSAIATLTGATLSATRSRLFYAQKYLRRAAARDPLLRELVGGDDDSR